MAKIENKNTNGYAFSVADGKVVSAEEMAQRCMEEGVNPHDLIFRCPGRSSTSYEKCEAELTLCSINENNLKRPYFAHRGNKKPHVTNCDCANDYISLVLSRTMDRTLSKLNPKLLLETITTGVDKKKEKDNEESAKTKTETPMIKREKGTISETEIKYVPINNIIDMYSVLAIAVNRAPHNRTQTGETAETLLINRKTVEKYKNGEISLNGVKLIVASGKNMNPNELVEMKESVEDAFWVLINEEYDKKPIYYILCAQDKRAIKKAMETLKPEDKDNKKLLVFGNIEKQNKIKDKLVCKVEIKAIKGGQIKVLKDKDSLE